MQDKAFTLIKNCDYIWDIDLRIDKYVYIIYMVIGYGHSYSHVIGRKSLAMKDKGCWILKAQ